ncbi:MAG: alkaline phosphatase family protein [Gaiellales bacterium]
MTRKVILVVIDGLTPAMLEGALERLPTLGALAEVGTLARATTTFPSLTPVCLSTIATGAHGDVHEIPHLVWWHRQEQRIVEYGSSFGAARKAGLTQTLRDTLVGMNAEHLGRNATTIFETLADQGLRTAAVNFTAYRGRTLHRSFLRPLGTVLGPEHFFFYNLFETAKTGAPLSWRNRPAGTIDRYATAAARWLVTRDDFDFLLFYLSDYDYASHAAGPDAAHDVLLRCDAAIGELVDAAGGLGPFLERYAILVVADHGQSHVREVADLRRVYASEPGTLLVASNRAAAVYRLDDSAPPVRTLATVVEREPSAEVVVFREGDAVVVRRQGEEASLTVRDGALEVGGAASILDQPDAIARTWAAAHCPNAGEVIVSATEGWEFVDMGGKAHHGGGSHGSLDAADSVVPVLGVGLDPPRRLAELAPAIRRHFDVP